MEWWVNACMIRRTEIANTLNESRCYRLAGTIGELLDWIFRELLIMPSYAAPAKPAPETLVVHAKSRVLELAWSGGERFRIPFELMRVYSPSAEVQGHGPGQEVLQTGKRLVTITGLAPVGNYAVQPTFSDGHESGIFTWGYLYFLGSQQEDLWRDYEKRLAEAGVNRDTPMAEKMGGACGHHH